jgi:DNA-binding NtrC family response regulator
MAETSSPLDPVHWQALFSAATEPIFLLNRQRRILLVNRAWEDFAGLTAERARGLACRRSKKPGSMAGAGIAASLAPPAEVLSGKAARLRRQCQTQTGLRWCDLEFSPLMGGEGLLAILGRVVSSEQQVPASTSPLPEKLQALRRRLPGRYRLDDFASALPALRRVADQARLACQTRVPVLLAGEPGTGKEWLARVIHHHGTTADHSFAAVDCQRLPARQLDELFFGGNGLTRRSDLGTIYLTEPAALPLDVQAKFRDWLAEPGAARPRVIAGLSDAPAEATDAGKLLEELRCALATLEITLPPLRDRLTDLPGLVEQFLERSASGDEAAVVGLAPEAWEAVRTYRWPGNLDELYAVLQSARRHASGRIELADLPAYLRQAVRLEEVPGRSLPRQLPLKLLKDQVERRLILLALRMARGNKSEAARLLAIERLSLLSRIKALGIEEGDAAKSESRESKTETVAKDPKSETNR